MQLLDISNKRILFASKLAIMYTLASNHFRIMTMITMASVEAQNGFGNLLDKAQRQMVSVTRRGRAVALVMSPEVLEDYVDARLAMQAEAEGFATTEETTDFLASLRHA